MKGGKKMRNKCQTCCFGAIMLLLCCYLLLLPCVGQSTVDLVASHSEDRKARDDASIKLAQMILLFQIESEAEDKNFHMLFSDLYPNNKLLRILSMTKMQSIALNDALVKQSKIIQDEGNVFIEKWSKTSDPKEKINYEEKFQENMLRHIAGYDLIVEKILSPEQRLLLRKLYFTYYKHGLVRIPKFKFYEILNLTKDQKHKLDTLKIQSITEMIKLLTEIISCSIQSDAIVDGKRQVGHAIAREEEYISKNQNLLENIHSILNPKLPPSNFISH